MPRVLCLVLAAALLVSCEPPPGAEPLAQRHDAIIGGADDASDSQVFLIDLTFDNSVRTVCSATLIGLRTLVTAAHCVDPARQTGASSVSIKATNRMIAAQASTSELIDVTETRLHPSWDPVAAKSSYDIALLLLARAATPAPRELNRAGLSGFVGKSMRVVGYGRTDPATSNSGTRRAVTATVTSDDTDHIFFGASGSAGICSGDSGGPSFHTFGDGVERLVGLHSYQLSASCGDGADVRIDRFLGFIDGWLAEKEPALCTVDKRCKAGCTPVDVDCLVNAALGDPCTEGVHLCAAGSVCSGPAGAATTCRPACATENACPGGTTCVEGQGSMRYCQADATSPPDEEPGGANGGVGCSSSPASALPFVLPLLLFVGRRAARRKI